MTNNNLWFTHREWRSVLGGVALQVGLWTHLEGEAAAADDVAVGDVVFKKRLAVELGTLDIDVLWAVVARLDDKLLAVLKGDGSLAEEGTAYDILIGAGCDGVEAEG